MFQASHSDPKCSVWLSLFLTSGNLFLVAFLAQSLLCGPYVCWPNKSGVYLPMSEARFLQILLGGHLRGSRVLLVEREREQADFGKAASISHLRAHLDVELSLVNI